MASYILVRVKEGLPVELSVFAYSNDLNRKTKFDHLFDKDKRVVHLLNIYWINFRRDVKDTRLRKKH